MTPRRAGGYYCPQFYRKEFKFHSDTAINYTEGAGGGTPPDGYRKYFSGILITVRRRIVYPTKINRHGQNEWPVDRTGIIILSNCTRSKTRSDYRIALGFKTNDIRIALDPIIPLNL